eukprot:SAG11_NODE_3374_length_2490_cov_1.438310_2_plen_406_part_00
MALRARTHGAVPRATARKEENGGGHKAHHANARVFLGARAAPNAEGALLRVRVRQAPRALLSACEASAHTGQRPSRTTRANNGCATLRATGACAGALYHRGIPYGRISMLHRPWDAARPYVIPRCFARFPRPARAAKPGGRERLSAAARARQSWQSLRSPGNSGTACAAVLRLDQPAASSSSARLVDSMIAPCAFAQPVARHTQMHRRNVWLLRKGRARSLVVLDLIIPLWRVRRSQVESCAPLHQRRSRWLAQKPSTVQVPHVALRMRGGDGPSRRERRRNDQPMHTHRRRPQTSHALLPRDIAPGWAAAQAAVMARRRVECTNRHWRWHHRWLHKGTTGGSTRAPQVAPQGHHRWLHEGTTGGSGATRAWQAHSCTSARLGSALCLRLAAFRSCSFSACNLRI